MNYGNTMKMLIDQILLVFVCALVLSPLPTQSADVKPTAAAPKATASKWVSRREMPALMQKHDEIQLASFEARLKDAMAAEAARREADIKLIKDKQDALDWTKIAPIGISAIAFLLSFVVWRDARRKGVRDRAESLAAAHLALSKEISEAKGFLGAKSALPGTPEHAQVVRVGNFFEHIADIYKDDPSMRERLTKQFKADIEDFWKRATSAGVAETNEWQSIGQMLA